MDKEQTKHAESCSNKCQSDSYESRNERYLFTLHKRYIVLTY